MEIDKLNSIINILYSLKYISSDLVSDIKTFPAMISKAGRNEFVEMGTYTNAPEKITADILGMIFIMPLSTQVAFDNSHTESLVDELAKYPSVLGLSIEFIQNSLQGTRKFKGRKSFKINGNLLEFPPKGQRDHLCLKYLLELNQKIYNNSMITLTFPSGYSPSLWFVDNTPEYSIIVDTLRNLILSQKKELVQLTKALKTNQPKAQQNQKKQTPTKNLPQKPQSQSEIDKKETVQNHTHTQGVDQSEIVSVPQKPITPTATPSPAMTPAKQQETFWLLQHIVLAAVQEQVFSTFPLTIYKQILFYHFGDILMPGSSISSTSLCSPQNRPLSPLVTNKKPAIQQSPVLKIQASSSPKNNSNLSNILENPSRYSGKKTYKLIISLDLMNTLTDLDRDLLCDLYHDPRNLHSYYRWQDFINLIDHMGGTIKIVGGVASCTFSWLQTNNRFNIHPPHGANGKLYDIGFADFATSGLTRVLGIEKL